MSNCPSFAAKCNGVAPWLLVAAWTQLRGRRTISCEAESKQLAKVEMLTHTGRGRFPAGLGSLILLRYERPSPLLRPTHHPTPMRPRINLSLSLPLHSAQFSPKLTALISSSSCPSSISHKHTSVLPANAASASEVCRVAGSVFLRSWSLSERRWM